jgi:8-oxo-dGTP pyrophosphatase MutT (NUDIX family)
VTDEDRFKRWAKEREAIERKGDLDEVTPLIPAATVIVIRDLPDHAGGIEALMLRRNSKLEFAGGMWVFPGGRVDDGDRHHDDDDDELPPARRAAVREAKEEADLDIDIDPLVVFSHWQPPPITPKRFSTWFFLASAPTGIAGDVAIDDGEIKDHAWLRPADALTRRDALDIELAPPTWVTLNELASYERVDDALAGTAAREPEHFETNISIDGEEVVALWHGDAGYEQRDASIDGPRHRLFMVKSGWRYERT